MDHRSSAREILSAIGGKENLVSAAHCATRLRLIIADNSKIQKDTLENIDVVKGVFEASGQLQIIIGTGTVNKVYDEFIAEAGVEASSKDEVKAQVAQKQNWFKRLIKTLGDVFVPIIPAIVAGGLIMGIMEALNFMASNGFISLDTNGKVTKIVAKITPGIANAIRMFVPKKELITEEIVFALIKSIGVNTSLSRTFIRSRIVRDIRASPTAN